ncbi:MAG: reverse transcriptase domain-containing protein [Gammaproteobacteria bacterium]
MATRKKDNATGFLQAHGHGPARLATILGRVHWTRADGVVRGRQALDLFLATCAELVVDAARRQRRTPSTFVGALVAEGDPAERPLLWLLGEYFADIRRQPLKLAASRRAMLTRAARPMRSHARLLVQGGLSASQLPDLVPNRPRSALVLMYRQLRARLPAGDPRIAAQLVRLTVRLGGDTPRPLLRTVRQLLAQDAHQSRITHALFRRLPATTRRAILFAPGIAAKLLDDAAQSAVRPPSPAFDPLYIEHALGRLADGSIDHVDLDALVLGARQHASLRNRIVEALADGSGRLDCAPDVRARLVGAAAQPELCLVACAAAQTPDAMRHALAALPGIPASGVLGEALHRFAVIAFADWQPAEVPAPLRDDPGFVAGMQADAARRLAAHVRGIEQHLAPAVLLRHLAAWLEHGAATGRRQPALAELHEAFQHAGHRFFADIEGPDAHALTVASPEGERLAMALLGAVRARDHARWEQHLFAQLTLADPGRAAACAWGDFRGHEVESLLHSPEASRVLHYFLQRPERRRTRGWRAFLQRIAGYERLPAALEETLAGLADDHALGWELAMTVPAARSHLFTHRSLDVLVDHAMHDRPFARELEKHVGRSQLAAHGRAQPAAASTAPGQAAAREVALAIGLEQGAYLNFLARRIRPPYDEHSSGRRFDDLYHTWTVPKRSGGDRTITAPAPALKSVQRAILDQLLSTLPVHPAATGFVTGRSIVDNATPHAGQPLVTNMDIRDFFPGTGVPLIRRTCLQLSERGLSTRACLFIADICSYHGGLPVGAPTSPTIANQVLRPVDHALAVAAARHDVRYTRYADDITFSGTHAATLLRFARRLLGKLGYTIDEKKTNLFRRGRRQMVTGLVVNVRPTMARALRRQLRAAVDRRARGEQPLWQGVPVSDAQLAGQLAFLAQTQPAESRALRARLRQVPPIIDNGSTAT